MKRIVTVIVALILASSMLAACGSKDDLGSNTAASNEGSSPGTNNASEEQNSSGSFNPILVKSSELITPEDAAQILGGEIKVDDLDEVDSFSMGSNSSTYDSVDHMMYYLYITVYSTAALDPERTLDKTQLEMGGIANYNDTIKEDRVNKEGAIILDGAWDWAVIHSQSAEIAYGDYNISIMINTSASNIKQTDDERIAQLTKTATLAFERLVAIVGD